MVLVLALAFWDGRGRRGLSARARDLVPPPARGTAAGATTGASSSIPKSADRSAPSSTLRLERLFPAPVNSLLTGLLTAENALARRLNFPFGVTILAIAVKP